MRSHLSRRWMLAIVTLVALTPTLAAGAGAETKPAVAPHSSITLTWFERTDLHENQWEKERVAAWEKLHPDIRVSLIVAPDAQFDAKINALLNSNPPDIFQPLGREGFADYYHRGLLYDYTPLIKQYGYDWGHTPPNIAAAYKRGHGLYAIPTITLGSFVFYNKDMFDAYNRAHPHDKLSYPPVDWNDKSWTWAKMVSYAKKLTNPAKHQYGILPNLYPIIPYAWLAGADFFTPSDYANGLPKSFNATNPAIENIFQQLADWQGKLHIAPRYSDFVAADTNGIDLFTSGNIGMELRHGAGFRNFNDVNFHWAAGALPYLKTDKDALFTDAYVMYKGTPHPKETFEFIKFLTSRPSMASYVNEVAFTPSNPDYLTLWYQHASSRTGLTVEQLKTLMVGALTRGQAAPDHVIANFGQIYDTLQQDLDPLYLGQKTAKQQMPVLQRDEMQVIQQIH